ncbi:penicillin-binding transpeptidase domain-containing protein [Sandaracinus amylolyticus]|uniref:penicillin-binding transpeptidase domain-containing protein n=1 Tax=Sandaracinus amylolyticus TaxID=927083 RepID=UPI001F3AB2B7|nr:penicillin-binding transpeptidase domain-containing protein [Sandaracinus amylolyticus]UJR80715.1 Penicillin-binding protein transpeptidase [Sandaracinus amylolyticus]
MVRSRIARLLVAIAMIGATGSIHVSPTHADDPIEATPRRAARASAPERTTAPATRPPRALRALDPRVHRAVDGTLVSDLPDGSTAILTLDPGLQGEMEGLFARYEVPWGALVAIEPATGRVLAYVSHSSAEADAEDLVLAPSAPAASVFKVITGAALIDAGVGPATRVCYHGGGSRLVREHLEDDPRRDTLCATLEEAMGGSINAVFAKLSDRHLEPATMERYASAFGFGEALPFDVPTTASPIDVPEERLERARAAAGFWHSRLSPLHGALIAATIANDGAMPRARIVESLIDGEGHVAYEQRPAVHRQVVGRLTARALNRMMQRTVSHGTARRAFHDERGNAFLPGIRVAGKTGTLSAERPYRGYTWFVGFAPADRPQIAVAALVVNRPEWRIKASFVAREALRHWLITRPRQQRAARAAE